MNQLPLSKSGLDDLSTTTKLQARTQSKDTIVQLLSSLANPKEISQYLDRFVNAGKTQFAVIKVGGAILADELEQFCTSIAFLQQIGLYPIILHGAGPQINQALKDSAIKSEFKDGQRVTTPQVLQTVKQVFTLQNIKLASKLQQLAVNTASITSGVFQAELVEDQSLGLVGKVTQVDLSPIQAAIENGLIPILSPMGQTPAGQFLNLNADVATNELATQLKPYKIIFLTNTGGILNADNKIISSVNLVTDYQELIQQPWLNGGMKLKLEQIAKILSRLPSTASVSMTKPAHLAKELFTHKGSGTLIRKGESIRIHDDIESIKQKKLSALLEQSFNKVLVDDYFTDLKIYQAIITNCYRAAAIVSQHQGIAFLDKFVVAEEAKGEGLGKAIWQKLIDQVPQFFWRAARDNPINSFYFAKSDGCFKSEKWIVYWKGLSEFKQIQTCVEYALAKPSSLQARPQEEQTPTQAYLEESS